jgi:hypothetical protein
VISLALVSGGLFVLGAIGDSPVPDVREYYEAAAAKAGHSADAHVRLALWCESHGMTAERMRHLALAVLSDPANTAARGLMGMVLERGRWLRPEAVTDRVHSDAELSNTLAEYEAKRAKAAVTADGQWKLALWCEQKGLNAEATAHFTAVVRLDPSRSQAWSRLGYRKHNGRWMTDAQIAEAKADAEAQAKADIHWRAKLDRWRLWLVRGSKRSEAEAALAEVLDPRAVPSIMRVFGTSDPARAAQLLGQIDAPRASRALALLAVTSESLEVRRAASEILRQRDPREFLSMVIGMLRNPIRYEVKPVGGPGSPGILVVEGKKFDIERLYAPPAAPSFALMPGDTLAFDDFGLPVIRRFLGVRTGQEFSPRDLTISGVDAKGVASIPGLNPTERSNLANDVSSLGSGEASVVGQAQASGRDLVAKFPVTAQIPIGRMQLEAQTAAAVAQSQLQADIMSIETANATFHKKNTRVLSLLATQTGQDLGEDPEVWNHWWTNEQGYAAVDAKPTPHPILLENVPLSYQPQQVGISIVTSSPVLEIAPHHSCFAAGTPVRTLDGARPIESIRVGDKLLTQDTESGALSFQPVVAAYHNPPNATFRIELGDDEIVATGIHRFWKAGRGWVMARDLEAGDAIRTLGGVETVSSVTPDSTQPVFNLEVASGQDFFVGKKGVLAHDNSIIKPTPRIFDAAPILATSGNSEASK